MATAKDRDRMRSKGYLGIKEVAEALDCHPRTVRNWVNTGDVDVEMVGGAWFIKSDSVASKYEDTPIAGDVRKSLKAALKG